MNTPIERAIKRNQAKRILPVWIREFTAATNRKIQASDFLSLDRTKQLKDTFVERLKERIDCCNKEWPVSDMDKLLATLDRMKNYINPTDVILFSNVDEYIGAICVQSDVIMNNVKAVLELMKNDIYFATPDLSSGFALEFEYYSISGEYHRNGIYRITTWGVFCIT